MKITSINCSSCGGNISYNEKISHCPYCGSLLKFGEDITITKNINIKKEYTDTADVIRAKNEQNQTKQTFTGVIILVIIFLAVLVLPHIINNAIDQKKTNDALSQGKIAIGCSYEDCVGKNYTEVLYQLQAAGFTNIVLNDLGTGGFLWLETDKIKSISVAGKTKFYSDDFFYPDAKIIITYY